MTSRKQLREQLRSRRRALSARERVQAAARLQHHLTRWPPFRRARRLAVYLPNDGEPDLRSLIRNCWAQRKQVYLPVLRPFGPPLLWFLEYRPGQRLLPNRFGIPEPWPRERPVPPRRLDLVLTPLVGFDARGNRLGMGGGFYDRSFAFLNRHPGWCRPRLVGIAHAFQQVPELPASRWDVPLAAVATDRGLLDLRG
ncbi:MAG: 5-formyltetrahydrofolate cyclo-ligase [Ectothiorhodospiraceae bacterium]|nr:5-formyltetrahydrofolate cyclo-ligase [Ectothiorhodospiraceae bacterium]